MTQQTNVFSDYRTISSHCHSKPPVPTAHITTAQGPPLAFCTAQEHQMQISSTEIFPYHAMHSILATTSQGSAFHCFPGQGWHNILAETSSQHSAAGLKTSAEMLQRCILLTQNSQAITRNHTTNFISYF